MQKEPTETMLSPKASEALPTDETTPETITDQGGGTNQGNQKQTDLPGETDGPDCAAGSQSFEELIKGPYKEAFAAKVQGIINKRFKELKTRQAQTETAAEHRGQKEQTHADPPAGGSSPDHAAIKSQLTEMGYDGIDLSSTLTDPTFEALINGGVDPQTAYNVLHFDEIMDGSIRYGASLAAKQLADSIRLKAGRPAENGLNDCGGFTARRGAAGLTPEKRRELARKALMGEEIGF